jgi:hypothetical protein
MKRGGFNAANLNVREYNSKILNLLTLDIQCQDKRVAGAGTYGSGRDVRPIIR